MVDIAEVSRDESREKRKKRLTLRNLKGSEQSVSANCNCTGCPGKGISILTNLYTFERRTRGEFCRNDFLAVGLYTLDRVFAITLFYVCIALCVKTTTTRGQGHESSTRIVFYNDSSTDSSGKYFVNIPSFRRSRYFRRKLYRIFPLFVKKKKKKKCSKCIYKN